MNPVLAGALLWGCAEACIGLFVGVYKHKQRVDQRHALLRTQRLTLWGLRAVTLRAEAQRWDSAHGRAVRAAIRTVVDDLIGGSKQPHEGGK